MTAPIESVACTARTPAQAKVFVAMLMAEGIPARIDGDTLTDEFAASRRLMNLLGTRVMVPTRSLDVARELLQPATIDGAELERQALAEAPMTTMPRPATLVEGGGSGPRWIAGALLLLLTLVTVLLALL